MSPSSSNSGDVSMSKNEQKHSWRREIRRTTVNSRNLVTSLWTYFFSNWSGWIYRKRKETESRITDEGIEGNDVYESGKDVINLSCNSSDKFRNFRPIMPIMLGYMKGGNCSNNFCRHQRQRPLELYLKMQFHSMKRLNNQASNMLGNSLPKSLIGQLQGKRSFGQMMSPNCPIGWKMFKTVQGSFRILINLLIVMSFSLSTEDHQITRSAHAI